MSDLKFSSSKGCYKHIFKRLIMINQKQKQHTIVMTEVFNKIFYQQKNIIFYFLNLSKYYRNTLNNCTISTNLFVFYSKRVSTNTHHHTSNMKRSVYLKHCLFLRKLPIIIVIFSTIWPLKCVCDHWRAIAPCYGFAE